MTTSRKYFTAAGIVFIAIIFYCIGCQKSYGADGKISITDTVPKQSYTYTRSFEVKYFQVSIDSLFFMGNQYIGSSLSKDEFNQIISVFNRIAIKLANGGKIDSIPVPKK